MYKSHRMVKERSRKYVLMKRIKHDYLDVFEGVMPDAICIAMHDDNCGIIKKYLRFPR